MGLIDCRKRGKEIKKKEHSQECERKGWWGEKGEEESRERGEIQRLEEGISFCSPIQQLSFEHLLGASPRARQWAYGSKQETEFLLLPNLPFTGRDRLVENRNRSFRITNCDQYCEGNKCGVERATVRPGEKGLLLQTV